MAPGGESTVFFLYLYTPSLGAAVAAVVLFFVATSVHAFRLGQRKALFTAPFVVGGIFECIGYIGRAINSRQTPEWTLGPYILQSVLILVAPALFAATIYMTLGRISRLCDADKHLLVRQTKLTKIFVAGDVLSFLTQSCGAGFMAAGTSNSADVGEDIVLAGLFLQIFFFSTFVTVGAIFHKKMRRDAGALARCSAIPWRNHMIALYSASALILVRSVYRVAEFFQGNTGFIVSHEWFLYVFDAVPMLLVMIIFIFVHGSELDGLIMKKGTHREGIMIRGV